MSTIYEIPLKVGTPQTFDITLGAKRYTATLQWRNDPQGGWFLDLYNALTLLPILCGIPLVTGANLLAQYDYLNFGGGLWVQSSHNAQINPDAVPTFSNLGVDGLLYWVTK